MVEVRDDVVSKDDGRLLKMNIIVMRYMCTGRSSPSPLPIEERIHASAPSVSIEQARVKPSSVFCILIPHRDHSFAISLRTYCPLVSLHVIHLLLAVSVCKGIYASIYADAASRSHAVANYAIYFYLASPAFTKTRHQSARPLRRGPNSPLAYVAPWSW